MKALQFTFIGKDARASVTVVGTDRKDITETAFNLVKHIAMPCAVICKPVHFTEAPCAA